MRINRYVARTAAAVMLAVGVTGCYTPLEVGAGTSSADAVSPAGVIAGQLENPAGERSVFVHRPDGQVTTVPMSARGAVGGVNDAGTVVGYVTQTIGWATYFRPRRWTASGEEALPLPSGDYGLAHDINEAGVIVGGASAPARAARWAPDAFAVDGTGAAVGYYTAEDGRHADRGTRSRR